MPKTLARALTDPACRSARPRPDRDYRLMDGEGLHLLVRKTGRKSWQVRLQAGGQDETSTLGDFPEVTLKQAREAAARKRLESRSPQARRRGSLTFGQATEEWLTIKTSGLTDTYAADVRERIRKNIPGDLAARPLGDIRRPDVIALLTVIVRRGAHSQARRVRALLDEFFEWAITNEFIETNPAPRTVLRALPAKPPVEHHPAAAFADMPIIFRTFAAYPSLVTSAALRLLVLTATRTSEVRLATWDEVDLDNAIWTIPAARMKAKREHRIPLSAAAVALLRSLPRVSPSGWIFPTPRADRPLSENGMLYATRSMFPTITPHGFRSTFSTWANDDQVADADVVEAALAHIVPGVRGAYFRGTLFDARRALMERWAEAVTADAT